MHIGTETFDVRGRTTLSEQRINQLTAANVPCCHVEAFQRLARYHFPDAKGGGEQGTMQLGPSRLRCSDVLIGFHTRRISN